VKRISQAACILGIIGCSTALGIIWGIGALVFGVALVILSLFWLTTFFWEF
jgi:hypothetical protein